MRSRFVSCLPACFGAALIVRSLLAADPQLLLLQGDVIPNTGGQTVGGSITPAAVNASGQVAVFATLSGVGSVISSAGGWHLVAQNGSSAPGSPGMNFDGIASGSVHIDDHGNTSLTSTLTGGRFMAIGIYIESGGVLAKIARDAEAAPSSPPGTYFMSGSIPFNCSNDGRMAFTSHFDATGTGVSYAAIFSGATGSISQHARQDAPPSNTGFTGFGGALINSSGAACAGVGFLGPTQRTGIYTGTSGGLQASATSDSPAPDSNGDPLPGDARFASFFAFDLNITNSVAFIATLKNSASSQGVFVKDAMGQRLIALDNTAVPLIPGAFYGAFAGPVLCDNGDILFSSNLFGSGINSSNSRTLFRCRGKVLSVVARDGDPCPGIPGATYVWNTSFSANSFGQIALTGFTGDGEAIVIGSQPNGTLSLVYRESTNLTFRSSLVRRVNSFSSLWFAGGNDGIQRSLNNAGQIALTCSVNIAPGQPFGQNGKGIVLFSLGSWCPADLNEDGVVDDSDFVIFVYAYNVLDCADAAMPAHCPADLNGDGFVDDADFVIFVAAYNELVCP